MTDFLNSLVSFSQEDGHGFFIADFLKPFGEFFGAFGDLLGNIK